jgi:hypothetical protein
LTGVPQGSILGPTLFLIYINDLCNLDIEGHIISFADDTLLIFAQKTWTETFTNANYCLAQVESWINKNKLVLNTDKTCYLNFSILNRDKPNSILNISLHGKLIDNKQNTCYLGVLIDENLRWTNHLEALSNKLKKFYCVFHKLRQVLDLNVLRKIYFAIFQSVLQYGIISWGGVLKTHLNPIQKIQNHILKIILTAPVRYSTEKTYRKLNVLNIRELFIKKILQIKPIEVDEESLHVKYNLRNKHLINRKNKMVGQRQASYFYCKLRPLISKQIKNLGRNIKSEKYMLKNIINDNDIMTMFK